MPAMTIAQAQERQRMLHDFIADQMVDGMDYGSIPGMEERTDAKTGEKLPPKKVLLKPGAEKFSTLFALRPRFEDVQTVEDWTGGDHNGEQFFYYRVKCSLWRDQELVCDADGSCNSMEKKYRYRLAAKKCPTCGKETIIKGKKEYGSGWICWKQKGGCGMKFADGEASIENQVSGQIPNPDIADLTNTILKMAQKRALIAAILIAANASDYFTQDIEEEGTDEKVKPVVVGATTENTRPPEPEVTPAQVRPAPVVASSKPDPKPEAKPARPYAPEVLKAAIATHAEKFANSGQKANEKFRGLICGVMEKAWEDQPSSDRERNRHSVLAYLTGKDSIKKIPDWTVHSIAEWLKWETDSGGLITLPQVVIQELNLILMQTLAEAGQQTLPEA